MKVSIINSPKIRGEIRKEVDYKCTPFSNVNSQLLQFSTVWILLTDHRDSLTFCQQTFHQWNKLSIELIHQHGIYVNCKIKQKLFSTANSSTAFSVFYIQNSMNMEFRQSAFIPVLLVHLIQFFKRCYIGIQSKKDS